MTFTALDTHVKSLLNLYLKKLTAIHAHDMVKKEFVRLFTLYYQGDSGKIPWNTIQPLERKEVIPFSSIKRLYHKEGIPLLSKTVILKLNGGLGTTMGCYGPKSAIALVKKKTFLDFIITQLSHLNKKYRVSVPLILLNSFKTSRETRKRLEGKSVYTELLQNQFPKIDAQSKRPFEYLNDSDMEWNPPGHGDLFLTLQISNALNQWIKEGKEYLFISNSDNLGALLEPSLLGYMKEKKKDFIMEAAEKTAMDKKGGTIIKRQGQWELLERIQVEQERLAEFEDIHKFPLFNTNTLWITLKALKRKLEETSFTLPLIVNPKQVGAHGVVQLETAMGAAIRWFESAQVVLVPRERFLPVETTADLMLLQSDFIQKHRDGRFTFHRSQTELPSLSLSRHFRDMEQYIQRVEEVPSLKNVQSLTLEGDITVGPKVVFKGTVSISVAEGKRLRLENQVFQNTSVKI